MALRGKVAVFVAFLSVTRRLPLFVDASIVRGSTTVSAGGVKFLTKFCYDSNLDLDAGVLNVTLRSQKKDSSGRVVLLLLDDQDESYPEESEAWNALSCEEKLSHGRKTWEVLPAAASPEGFKMQVSIREKIRPRWWYVTIADCSTSGFEADFDVHMWNPRQAWESEFSMDRRGVFLLCFVFLLVHGAVAGAQFHANHMGGRVAHADHPLVRLLSAEVACAACAALLLCMHYAQYARDGEGLPTFEFIARLALWTSKCQVMCIVLLVSQGVCVSRPMTFRDLTHWLRWLAPFCFLCFILELWGDQAESQKYNTHFAYATKFGTMLVVVDLCWLLIYVDNLRGTLAVEKSSRRRHFYTTWGAAYGVWFLVLPVVALLSHLLAPWVCFRIAMATIHGSHAVVSVALVWALWPYRAESHFKLATVELAALAESSDENAPLMM